jgi:ketosteroid isomerase-like protein
MNADRVLDFIAAINNADIDKICGLITNDHLFIDSRDNRETGKENMKKAWIGYFALFPDYKIEVDEILVKDSIICLLGYASGTYKNLKNAINSNHWRIPAAWTARTEGNKIQVWQVYADNIIVLNIIKKNDEKP